MENGPTQDDLLARIRNARTSLDEQTRVTDAARTRMYRRVREAKNAGTPLSAIAKAAGWSTKQAVYDAVARLDLAGE
jgi:hypothetical protein